MFFVISGYVTEKLFYIRVIEFIEEVFLFLIRSITIDWGDIFKFTGIGPTTKSAK